MNIEKHQSQTKLGAVELFTFTYCASVTVGFVFLPYISAEEIRSAWLKVILAVIPYFIFLYLYKKVTDKYKDRDVLKIFKTYSFSWVYYLIIFYFFCSAMYSVFFGTKGLVIIVQTYLMQDTKQWIIATYFLFVVGLSVFYGITAISRMLVVIFFHEIILILTLVLFLFSENFYWINIQPVLSVDVFTLIKSSISEISRYAGIITLFAFLPYVNKDVKAFKPISFSLFMIMVTYFLVCMTTLGVFGFEQALSQLSPVTALMQTVSSPAGLFERMDLFFLTVWVMSFYKIALIFIWFCSTLLKVLIPIKNKDWIHVTIVTVVAMFLTNLTPSITNIPWEPYNLNSIIYSLIIPTLIFIYLLFRHKQGVEK